MAEASAKAPRILVYSCYVGAYEPFNPQATGAGQGYDRAVLSDQPLVVPGVRVLPLRPDAGQALTPTQLSRLAKMRPHLHFAEYDWVFYIDNSATLMADPLAVVAAIEAASDGRAPAGRYLFAHQRRTCAYREARLCLKKGRIPRADYRAQVAHYQAAGFPPDQGLFVNTLMVQKMGDPATDAFNDAWFAHFLAFSARDQISLPFMLWQQHYPLRLMPFSLFDLAKWPVFKRFRRQQFQSAQRARLAKRAMLAPANVNAQADALSPAL